MKHLDYNLETFAKTEEYSENEKFRLNYQKLWLRCLVVYLMDGAADPTMDL